MSLCALVSIALLSGVGTSLAPVWKGDFTFSIKGTGKASGPGPSNGSWKIDREAKGTIIVDRMFRGGGIAGTPDTRNTARYETWISDSKRPIQVRIHDLVNVRGPLFAANQIRYDTFKYNCPTEGADDSWQPGKVASPILQFDYKEGKVTWESPRFYANAQTYFKREFVAGPASWTSHKPLLEDKVELEFEMIHALVQPSEWFRITLPFKEGQSQIVITKKFPFKVNLGASIPGQLLQAELSLVLRKGEPGG